MPTPADSGNFVLAVPYRTNYYNAYARVLQEKGLLRFYALGTRRGADGISPDNTRLNPKIGLCAYIAAKTLGAFQAESFRFSLLPWFDRWVLKQLTPGDHIISSYGYTNECFKFARQHGGKTFVDAGNSHIENFWEILSEEHRRWKCPTPPAAPHWYERAKAMLSTDVDFVLSPSSYVTQSFLARGFRPDQILHVPYPIDLSVFQPRPKPRPKSRPLTLINTGSLSLRKGTPYLLEAFRIVQKSIPSARLLLTDLVQDDVRPILKTFRDLRIEWAPPLPHPQLVERLHAADVFVLPSLEEGLVRTACEAMACGLQVVLTPNCGANDFVRPGVNGEVVPIRDPKATADAILQCWERVQNGGAVPVKDLQDKLSVATFEKNFTEQLAKLSLG